MNKKLYALTALRSGDPVTCKGSTELDGPDYVFRVARRKGGMGPLGRVTKDYEAGERIYELGDGRGNAWLVASAEDNARFREGPPDKLAEMLDGLKYEPIPYKQGMDFERKGVVPTDVIREMQRKAGEWGIGEIS